WLKKNRDAEIQNSPDLDTVRKAVEALTPEQRRRFQENFVRWSDLPPEEKKGLRNREELRKKFMEREIDAALRESGLQLNSEQRELFIKRYAEERRQVEEQLRKEMAEKRKPLVREILGRLKTEFAAGPVAATPAPATPAAGSL
ncbi:MAG TPA: hypothetical protein VGO90_03520, partial [Chthoniobacteraceae bacterium]|nr:hypothetical protein [Chthoniobacteraceae bacterium]